MDRRKYKGEEVPTTHGPATNHPIRLPSLVLCRLELSIWETSLVSTQHGVLVTFQDTASFGTCGIAQSAPTGLLTSNKAEPSSVDSRL